MSETGTDKALLLLRHLLGPLVDGFEIDDPQQGLVATVSVTGGIFIHPQTREPIESLRIYGAGADRVKIFDPRFLYSLGTVEVAGLSHASGLCAKVAKMLSEKLVVLGGIRDQVAAMGIGLDLEHDVLRLSGALRLQDMHLRLSAWQPGRLVVCGLGEKDLSGDIKRHERTLELTNQPTADLDGLARLAREIDSRLRSAVVEDVERELDLWPGAVNPQDESEDEKKDTAATHGTGDKAGNVDNSDDEEELRQRFADGTSDILELTEMVEEESDAENAEEQGPANAKAEEEPGQIQRQTDESSSLLGMIAVKDIFEKLGSESKVAAFGGRLRVEVPLKVLQGTYVFYLEQRGPTVFKGYVVSPGGSKNPVEFDLRSIMDLKEVLDRVLMG